MPSPQGCSINTESALPDELFDDDNDADTVMVAEVDDAVTVPPVEVDVFEADDRPLLHETTPKVATTATNKKNCLYTVFIIKIV